MSETNPVVAACAALGSAASLARAVAVSPGMVTQWARGIRPVAVDRACTIERATAEAGSMVDVHTLRPDVAWSRIPDPTWPHPAGRPVIDVARPVAAQEAA